MEKAKSCLEKTKTIYFDLPWWGKVLGLLFFLYVAIKLIPVVAQILQAVVFIAVMFMIFLSQFSNEEIEEKVNDFSAHALSYLKGGVDAE